MMSKGIFLAACKERHTDYDIVYNDYDAKYCCDLTCDMMLVDLEPYDYLIATPPCNYYSRANYRRNSSAYALATKHLLPDILIKFALTGKPFIVENVRSSNLFRSEGIYDICDKYNINIYTVGRHTYFTNVFINLLCPQHYDFMRYKNGKAGTYKSYDNPDDYRQGGTNVFNVIDLWLSVVIGHAS